MTSLGIPLPLIPLSIAPFALTSSSLAISCISRTASRIPVAPPPRRKRSSSESELAEAMSPGTTKVRREAWWGMDRMTRARVCAMERCDRPWSMAESGSDGEGERSWSCKESSESVADREYFSNDARVGNEGDVMFSSCLGVFPSSASEEEPRVNGGGDGLERQ
jgi:hypothetical protein